NALGSRTDVGWEHGISVGEDGKKIQCKYCHKIFSGGVYRLKHHLAGTQKDVGACTTVSDEVKKQMWDVVSGLQVNLMKKTNMGGASPGEATKEVDTTGEKRKGKELDGNIFKKTRISTQTTINNIFKKNLREEVCLEISAFFYNNGIPFNVSRSEEYSRMFEKAIRYGQGFKPPSYHELRVPLLKKHVELVQQSLEEHREYWKQVGCTIMTDGWTDKRRRTILNFLVNSPKGTVFLKSIDASHITKTADKIFKMIDDVVEEVGEENVIQVVTDNAANYKAVGEMLMKKRKKLFWTPCAAHCIDLMLEDLEKKVTLHKDTIYKGRKITTYIYARTALIALLHIHTKGKDLVRPGMTRFATSYLTLGCLNDNKGSLIKMFLSDQWTSSNFAKTKDGKIIASVVLDKVFWKEVVICLRAAYPLLHVLRMVDSEEKPAMGFIYEEMTSAKKKIRDAFQGVETSYIPIWDIIDARWGNQLHRPLHAAGYYLNPQIHYSSGFKIAYELKKQFYACMERMTGNPDLITKMDFFGSKVAQNAIYTKTPAQWWDSYGDQHPELQQFAIRVLNLTCSSSGCERNWSAFEMVHTKRRNRLKAKTMNDVVFVMTNSRLAKKKQTRRSLDYDYSLDELDSDEEWIVAVEDGEEEDLDALISDPDLNDGASGNRVVGASKDLLAIPYLDDDEFEELLQRPLPPAPDNDEDGNAK
ncbi:hypothetical protein S83_063027, partial [Arachis hypogaea]